ncbi:MAG TPA: hypothetical protein VGP62_16215 [Bryobacteraceae bacterium]|nr:hypothetical protein [Bryobacteraceae bacterium]
MPRILSILLLGALCSCERYPDSYPPPEQRHPVEGVNPDPSTMFVEMSSPDAAWHFVKDIEPGVPGDQWHWTKQNPTLRILAVTTQNLKFSVDLSLWDVAFRQTGPVEITFLVNGRTLDKIRYTSPGEKHFEKPIPADWLTTDVESIVSMNIDKLYTAPQDGVKFGFILSRIGFVR